MLRKLELRSCSINQLSFIIIVGHLNTGTSLHFHLEEHNMMTNHMILFFLMLTDRNIVRIYVSKDNVTRELIYFF